MTYKIGHFTVTVTKVFALKNSLSFLEIGNGQTMVRQVEKKNCFD